MPYIPIAEARGFTALSVKENGDKAITVCSQCGQCEAICPIQAISKDRNGVYRIDKSSASEELTASLEEFSGRTSMLAATSRKLDDLSKGLLAAARGGEASKALKSINQIVVELSKSINHIDESVMSKM